jgi:sucrose-6-phosphate hydrolase SacC (GH32 family)
MRYSPPGLSVNDFDVIKLDDGFYHLIHLQSPQVDPVEFDATIMETSYGHAISMDLIHWTTQDAVFKISSSPQFDDSALWTMRVITFDGRLWMFYTGLSKQKYFYQQIGLAASNRKDGTGWKRYQKEALISINTRYYQTDGKGKTGMAWRDPFVVFDNEKQHWVMFIAAKTNRGDKYKRGCIGMAVSQDLLKWEVKEPILTPGKYCEMECPVLYHYKGNYFLFVSISDDARVHVFHSQSIYGPFQETGYLTQSFNYAPRIIDDPSGDPVVLHTCAKRWQNSDTGDTMRGYISQPKYLKFDNNKSPYLGFYNPIVSFFRRIQSNFVEKGLLSVDLSTHYKKVNICFRTTGMGLDKKGLELILSNNRLKLQYIEDEQIVQATNVNQKKLLKNIKILIWQEYIEIYVDDRLYISTMAYRHREGRCEVWADKKSLDFCLMEVNPIK